MKQVLLICILGSPALLAQSTVTGSRTVQGNWDASAASATKPAKAGATLPGSCSSGEFFFNTAAISGQNIYLCNPSNTWSQVTAGGGTHNLLSSTHGDTTTANPTRGALVAGQGASPTWSALALGATSRFLRSNGTDLVYSSGPAAGAGACSAGQVMTAANNDAAPTCAATVGANTTGNAATATGLASTPSQCGTNSFATGVAASGNANCGQPAFSNLSGSLTIAQIPANVKARAIGTTFSGGGGAISAGSVNYFTVPFACTISAWNITVDTGTATIDVWKIATGTAVPTVSNTIAASAPPAISSGTALHSTTLTGWTTSVSANDIVAFQVKAVSNSTVASLILECDQ
jgi:hypothetical protein